MYPDQVRKIREQQEHAGTVSTELLARRDQALVYVARRFRYRAITPDESATIEYWVLNGGRRPWGL